jgi:hypothetical protein
MGGKQKPQVRHDVCKKKREQLCADQQISVFVTRNQMSHALHF